MLGLLNVREQDLNKVMRNPFSDAPQSGREPSEALAKKFQDWFSEYKKVPTHRCSLVLSAFFVAQSDIGDMFQGLVCVECVCTNPACKQTAVHYESMASGVLPLAIPVLQVQFAFRARVMMFASPGRSRLLASMRLAWSGFPSM